VAGAQQRFNAGDLTLAPRYLVLDVRRYFGIAAVGCGAHLWPVFARHPI
jgi:hypothetical protein